MLIICPLLMSAISSLFPNLIKSINIFTGTDSRNITLVYPKPFQKIRLEKT